MKILTILITQILFMSYEFTSIERELQPRQIKNAFTNFNGTTNQKPLQKSKRNPIQNEQNSPDKNQQTFLEICEKYKTQFINECLRIKDSINKHKIRDSKDIFARYIATNYSGLKRLYNQKESRKPSGSEVHKTNFNQKFLQYATTQIHHDLQTLLVLPLKEFMESTFQKELIENHLFDSPIGTFLKAIKSHKVSLAKHTKIPSEDYKPIFSPVFKRFFTLKYNGHHAEALYHQFLEEKYENFKSSLKIQLGNLNDQFEKTRFLNDIKISIIEVSDLFLDEIDHNRHNFKPYKYHRKDAFDLLSLKLHHLNIIKSGEKFHLTLAQLTQIQNIFITQSLKFVKFEISECHQQYKFNREKQSSQKILKKQGIFKKLQWNGNINQLITFFYDAANQVKVNGQPILIGTNKDIVEVLTENFIQKDGSPINPDTIATLLSPSKELKRAPLHKRIKFPEN